MHDLNDLYFFHAVVLYQGFAAAAWQTGIPKSTLSKSVARLEHRLQVGLLERSTRSIRTTDVGRAVFEQCQSMIAAAEAAQAAAAQSHAEPQGVVRVSCPQGLVQDLLTEILPGFLREHPKVRVHLKVMNRAVDLIEDQVDIALRARTRLDTDLDLIVLPLGLSRLIVAASPSLLSDNPVEVDSLYRFPTLSMTDDVDADVWELIGPGGETRSIHHQPRLFCSNFDLLKKAAIDGLGVASCRYIFAARR